MLIGIPKELAAGEDRVAIIPSDAKKLVRAGATVQIEAGLGAGSGYADQEYTDAGAEVIADRSAILSAADIVLRIRKPDVGEVAQLKQGCIHISYLDPFNEHDLIKAFRDRGITAISMEMIPRSTRSQKMDALSSQASLAGYVMVLLAATKLPRILPMMMTPAGTLKPATVFVIGAGVAGLQAIATAKRLGAKVVAFDTRPVVAEQVQSLGGKFLEIDLGETGQTKDGYAVELTEEQRQLQLEGQKKQIAESDIVITTAQVFGRKAPVVVTKDMVAAMKPGSVIVDMAAESGGNVEGTVAGETVDVDGVTIIGTGNWPNYVSRDASQMYSSNLFNLVDEGWDQEGKAFKVDFDNDILQGCIITHGGEIVNDTIKNLIK
ncbi:Re/Si-specific NAD(P)(+) transhydrogenase subunit alpha [Spongiibacter nanhainus]|uniref:proton-translocating NAD(P)(+) transhydrogenase n=1 Tax=Spongiibacter nanhainus TaxID=2794344 RepID=A0A7T4URU1_9GAMM|nr:Re/Si-specific NAD(P)(+) transhydrogenase subunit alpha [Spongiibacter nanhainus]QQD19613.1 Re/Si-specific NAD(P)(+) transhydrogenase subunit alpha [Spongiibacter nanhainus]